MQAAGMQESLVNVQENEIKRLSSLQFTGKGKEGLMEAAKQFEAVFVNQLFKAMESTIQKDGMFSGGKGEEMFKSMFYDEIAKDISSNPHTSFGFAKQIYEQMKDLV